MKIAAAACISEEMLRVRHLSSTLRPLSRHMADSASKMIIAVVSPPDNPALRAMPADVAEFVVGNSMEALLADQRTANAEALLWVPPGDPGVLSQVFPHTPRVRWCHSFFAGVDALAPFVREHLLPGGGGGDGSSAAAESKPEVGLSNGKGAFSDSLAEWVMTSVLHFNKQIPRVMANRQEKVWDKFVMNTVAGKTIGFVGFGHIAQASARLAKAFGMQVLALRRSGAVGDGADETLGPQQKLDLFRRSDYVVCVLPGTEQTADFCSTEEFGAMKSDAVFISIGRGLAVDEDALARALREGQIAGAAVDVFKTEPLPQESGLWACDNLLLTAHNADFTDDYFELGWSVWRKNFDALCSGGGLVTEVDKRAGY